MKANKRSFALLTAAALLCAIFTLGLTSCGYYTQKDIDSAVDEATAPLNTQISNLNKSISEKETALKALETEKATLAAEKTALQAKIDELDEKNAALESEKETLEKKVEALEGEKTALTDKKTALEAEVKLLKEKVATLEAGEDTDNEEITNLKAKISTLEADKEKLEKDISDLNGTLSEKNTEIDNLNKTVSDLKEERDTLNASAQYLQNSIDEKEDEIEALELSITDLEGEKSDLEARVKELENENKELADKNSALEEENAEQKIKINCLTGIHVVDTEKSISYTWAVGYSTCTAKGVCKHCEGEVTETANSVLTDDTYTATFTNTAFAAQTCINDGSILIAAGQTYTYYANDTKTATITNTGEEGVRLLSVNAYKSTLTIPVGGHVKVKNTSGDEYSYSATEDGDCTLELFSSGVTDIESGSLSVADGETVFLNVLFTNNTGKAVTITAESALTLTLTGTQSVRLKNHVFTNGTIEFFSYNNCRYVHLSAGKSITISRYDQASATATITAGASGCGLSAYISDANSESLLYFQDGSFKIGDVEYAATAEMAGVYVYSDCVKLIDNDRVTINGIAIRGNDNEMKSRIDVNDAGAFTISENSVTVTLNAGESVTFTNGSGFTLSGGESGATYTVNVDGTYSEVTE